MAELDDIFGDEGFDADMYDIPAETPAEVFAAELVGTGTAIVPAGVAPIFQARNHVPSGYERDAEDYYQGGHVVGKGDATIKVKETLKAIGCKWHPLRNVWVAADAAMLARARDIVKGGVNLPNAGAPKFTINQRGAAQRAPVPPPALPHGATVPTPSAWYPGEPIASSDPDIDIDPAPVDVPAPGDDDEPAEPAEPAEDDSTPVITSVGAAPAQQAFPTTRKPKQSKLDGQRKKLQGISTQALIQELVDRRVLEELPETLGDALGMLMPDDDELEQAFDLGDLE